MTDIRFLIAHEVLSCTCLPSSAVTCTINNVLLFTNQLIGFVQKTKCSIKLTISNAYNTMNEYNFTIWKRVL